MGLTDLEPRVAALTRTGQAINLMTLGAIVTSIIQFFAIILGFLDILVQFLLGYNVPELGFAKSNFMWYKNQWMYVIWGDGSVNWLWFN